MRVHGTLHCADGGAHLAGGGAVQASAARGAPLADTSTAVEQELPVKRVKSVPQTHCVVLPGQHVRPRPPDRGGEADRQDNQADHTVVQSATQLRLADYN